MKSGRCLGGIVTTGDPLVFRGAGANYAAVFRLGEVYDLGLAGDRYFFTHVLHLVSGSLLKFLGNCLRAGCSWTDCKSRLLDEYFPYFVRESLVRDLKIFELHLVCEPLGEYFERISQAGTFLKCKASVQKLVDRILMNLENLF